MPIKLYLQKQAVGPPALRPHSLPVLCLMNHSSHQSKAANFGILSAPALGVYFQFIKSRFLIDVSSWDALGISRLISSCH